MTRPNPSVMNIAIIGAGAIGSYYGARLSAAGHHVKFLLRSDYTHVRANGLEIRSIHGDFTLPEVQTFQYSEQIGEVDLVILAWKTTSNQHAAEVITPLLGRETRILTLQNGLGNIEHLGALFGMQRLLGGLCFVCINRISPGVIHHSASGLIRIANADRPIDAYLQTLLTHFKHAGIRCEGIDDLEKALWMKLVWNFPFNGLAIAEGGVDTEVLLKQKNLEPLIRKLMHEVITVGRALGHDIPYTLIDQQIAITHPMGPYKPSSMIDFVAAKPVEFDAIWKIPLSVALAQQVEVPRMAELTARIAKRLAH